MRVRKDQRGFTIVELLIAVAILSIVVASVCGFILVGSNSYAAANSDINVQQSAQLALNQMSDVLIDTTRSVNYMGYDGDGKPHKALKDAEFTFAPENKSLVMYNGVVEENMTPTGTPTTEVKEGNGNKHYHFYWSREAKKLYYAELNVQPGDVDTSTISFPTPPTYDPSNPTAAPPAGWFELAAHVTDFSVDLTQVEEKRVVMLALTFLDGKKEYVTSNNVTIRNKVAVNDAKLDPLDKKKSLAVKIMDAPIVEPGETFHFSIPKVTGKNVADKSVTWSVTTSGSPTNGTTFTDSGNGILKVASDEPAGTVKVTVTTNAKDSEGKQASDTAEVAIKRVYPEGTGVILAKSEDSDTENGPLEISPGCTFTISAAVFGNRLGDVCSVCGDDTAIDKCVVHEGNKYGNPYKWQIVEDPSKSWYPVQDGHLKLVSSDEHSATFYLSPDAPVDDNGTYKYTIQAMSFLSTQGNAHGRQYDAWVPGTIVLNGKKGKEQAEPISGELKYGDETLIREVNADMPKDNNRDVEAIRVVDNSGKSPDRILLHYTVGNGENFRVSPDLFDLDLNGSYTFYIQAFSPIPKDKYVPGSGGPEDDKETIKKIYFENIKNNTASQGYTGDRYMHSRVFYAKLDKPKITYHFNGVDYKAKNATLDTINIYSVENQMVGELRPVIDSGYENIWGDRWEDMRYTVYEGEGAKRDKLLYYDMKSEKYVPEDKKIMSNTVSVDPRGSMFLKLEDKNNREKACGSYHIVPGMVYQNKDPGRYEIIGWQGFDFDKLPREKRYYEFEESTIHVRVTNEFTMDIDHPDFKGQAMFPLPKEMQKNPLFSNINSLEWQTTASKLTVDAKRDNSGNTEKLTFNYVRYRCVDRGTAWEVEPVRHEYDKETKKIRVHSYGIYKCGENDKKWGFVSRGGTTEKEFTIQRFEYNNNTYLVDFPLPTDSDFPFVGGTGEIERTLELFDSNMNQVQNVPKFKVTCEKNGDTYEIAFRTEMKDNPYAPDNHKIKVVIYGTYTWSQGQTKPTEWTWKSGNMVDYTTDLVTNLENILVKINNGNYVPCKMYFPLPSESKFPFKGDTKEIICGGEYVAYKMTDKYGEEVIKDLTWGGTKVKYTYSSNTHTITFINIWDSNKVLGTYTCTDDGRQWTN